MRREGRPVFLNVLQIRLPIPGIVSFGHRISGVLLFLAIPLSIYLLDRSLHDPQGFSDVKALTGSILFLPVLLALLWSLSHHLLAGIRFLFIDIDLGVDKPTARKTAWGVLGGGVVLALILLGVWL
ncbi:MAG: succinate dehydrogenase, cytochrome b556 subunit [Chromatiales bacterium]|jgi:succinate dehydrogenase / fumarate reductase cytochrome b subunit|nr:succinate dehydrogenase, cytochrome b556 subunit [Chromatiales bacterium]MDX9768199.1 succinate dehydrogenase, cytochrome b556 subunit [Ectothiorhodospiraceae bacterium]